MTLWHTLSTPGHGAQPALDELAAAVALGRERVQARLQIPAVHSWGTSSTEAEALALATRLTAAGLKAVVLCDDDLHGPAPAVDVESVGGRDGSVELLGPGGELLCRIDRSRRVLAVAADLAADPDFLRAAAGSGFLPEARSRLEEAGRGDAILRLFIHGDGRSYILRWRRVRPGTLTEPAPASAHLLFERLLNRIARSADHLVLDLDFGLGELPPPRADAPDHGAADTFERHARLARALWLRGQFDGRTAAERDGRASDPWRGVEAAHAPLAAAASNSRTPEATPEPLPRPRTRGFPLLAASWILPFALFWVWERSGRERLPSDRFVLALVPTGGVIILSAAERFRSKGASWDTVAWLTLGVSLLALGGWAWS